MRRQRGYSLIELMAAVAILALIITTTLAAFMYRERRMKQAGNLIRVYQCLANEAEYVRRLPYDAITGPASLGRCDEILAPLAPFKAEMEVVPVGLDRKNVTLVIRWQEAKRDKEAKLGLIRTNTGGQNLW
jgi:prepilin-type N-terminal cleavage/methylation domain-containing protein